MKYLPPAARLGSTIELLESRIVLAGITAVEALNAKLLEFAKQKSSTDTAPLQSVATAKADDLVYAVFAVLQDGTFAGTDPALSEAAELAKAALTTQNFKTRADKDKICARIVNAAIQGSGAADSAAEVAEILQAVLSVNAGTTKPLTTAGKAAATAQALKSADALNAGEDIAAALVAQLSTSNGKLPAVAISTLKLVGDDTEQVPSFVHYLLDQGTNDEAFALDVAKGLAATASKAAGAVIGAYAEDLPNDDAITALAQKALLDTKLIKARAAIVAATGESIGDLVAYTTDLLSVFPGAKATVSVRAVIASGALHADANLHADAIIDAALENRTLTKADVPVFAATAATGNGDTVLAANIVQRMIADYASDNATNQINIGKAVMKVIAVANPEAAYDIGFDMAAGGSFDGATLQKQLAGGLALAVPTNPKVTGAAVAGVIDGAGENALAIAATAISKAPKSTAGILQAISSLSTASTNMTQFALDLIPLAGIANVAGIAAGVAAADQDHAGSIAAALANLNEATRSKALTIAGSVALAVDVDHVADIGQKVAAILGTAPKLPKLTSLGSLATSMAKAINTKPLVTTAERIDELGELAAAMVDEVLKKTPGDLEVAKMATSIGTSVMKGVSAATLINAGAFAADLKDVSEDLAGSIAQTISISSDLNPTQKIGLLGATGTLVKALQKGAKASFAGKVTTAFDHVRGTNNAGIGGLYQDPDSTKNETVGKNGVATGPAKYEIGRFDDPRTPATGL